MARLIEEKLRQLGERRSGFDRIGRLSTEAANDVLRKSLSTEPWQRRAVAQPHTRYALGAMQPVSADYTRIGLETAQRVGRQLEAGLPALGIWVTFALQGSVPLDVHIRGVSDVDLLALDAGFLTYDPGGGRALSRGYTSPTGRSSLDVLGALRRESERLLKAKFPAATVDCAGGKCIALSGGSLARPVDVVPSHWHDTAAYQASGQQHDRAVTILDKKVPRTLDNLPFTHMKLVGDRDVSVLGGLRKAVRLVKNVKNDAENEAGAAKLPSFDIAALLYHADAGALRSGHSYELAILREAQRFFDWCYANQNVAGRLRTPDETRVVLDAASKMEGLRTISCELDVLAREVAREQLAMMPGIDPDLRQIDEALRRTYVPAAA